MAQKPPRTADRGSLRKDNDSRVNAPPESLALPAVSLDSRIFCATFSRQFVSNPKKEGQSRAICRLKGSCQNNHAPFTCVSIVDCSTFTGFPPYRLAD
jgi:hypothetical protein